MFDPLDVQKVLSILQEADTLFRGFKDKCGKVRDYVAVL